MTALSEYQRLESTALWRDAPDAQRREVMVSLGDATLVITSLSDRPLSHWSLPAIARLNPGRKPAIYAPGATADEVLEIADSDMIDAIEKLRGAIEHARPHPGRLRLVLIAAMALFVAVLSVFWLPGALTRQTASILPDAKRAQLGHDLLDQMALLVGTPCGDEAGRQALGRLAERVLGPDAPRLVVLPQALAGTAQLPGGLLVLDRGLVEDHETPEVLAGFLLAQGLQAEDPALRLLSDSGLGTTLRLLTTGRISNAPLHDHAMRLLTEAPPPIPEETLLQAFAEAEISSQPYAYALDLTGETTLGLIEADPLRNRQTDPLISDQAWIALQGICGG